jgi:hypothetical protein|nr:MAG TPA: hypothetical protein [Caudoviricetes sp.]
MLYAKEEVNKFKGNLKSSVQSWAEDKIDSLTAEKPRLKPASVYMKRGLSNWLDKEDDRLNKMIDNMMLFVSDKNGGIDSDLLINDAVDMFKMMDKQQMQLGAFSLEYGKGEILISIPHNPWLDLIFGDLGQIKLTADDLLEIKNLLN